VRRPLIRTSKSTKRAAISSFAAILIAGITAPAASAQSPKFEVVSVKVNQSESGSRGFPFLINGKLTAKKTTFRWMLQAAWGLGALQISGPNWIDSDYFEVAATSPSGVPDSELMPMPQALLQDRFQLAAHLEKREMPVYELVVGKESLKVAEFDVSHIPPTPRRNGAASMIIGGMTMSGLALNLTTAVGRPVIDKTGLDKRYFCILQYSPLSTEATDSTSVDIFAAVQQQLGLKLEAAKAALDFLVVDHAERLPSDN
jgi:uncharacterized protein (TIGR03435 family)